LRTAARRTAKWLAANEPVLVLGLMPWLLAPDFSEPISALALLLLPVLWLIRVLAERPIMVRSPLNWPLLLLLASVIPAVYFAPQPAAAADHAAALVGGFATFAAILNGDSRWRRPVTGAAFLTVVGATLCLAQVLRDRWIAERWSWLTGARTGLQTTSQAGVGIPPWLLAGLLAVLLPAVVGYALACHRRTSQPLMGRWQGLLVISILAAGLMAVTLVLCGSRMAVLVILLLAMALIGVRSRLAGVIGSAVALTTGLLLLIGLLTGHLVSWVTLLDDASWIGADPSPWLRRLELWRNAVLVLRDYPLSGVGIGFFRPVAWQNYPFYRVSPLSFASDPRNMMLHAGVDLGAGGLAAFSLLAVVLVLVGWTARNRQTDEDRILVSGFWFGILAWLGYGTVASIPLWSASGWLVWVLMGLTVGSWQETHVDSAPMDRRRLVLSDLAGLGLLVMLVVAAANSSWWAHNRAANLLDRALLTGDRQALNASLAMLEEVSDQPGALRRRASALYEMGHREQSVRLFQSDEQAAAFLFSLGRLRLAQGDLDQAEAVVDLGLAVEPRSGRLACLAGDVQQALGNLSGALRFYRLVPSQPSDLDGDRTLLARCYHQLGMVQKELNWWGEAAASFEVAATLDDGEVSYWTEQGQAVYRATGDLSRAVYVFESALAANPNSNQVMLTLAELYLYAGRGQKALEWSDRMVEENPNDPAGWLLLAQAYRMLDRGNEAARALDQALRLDRVNPVALGLQEAWGNP